MTVLQSGRRGIALAATAGESGENKADRQGTFYNRKAELQSLGALLGEPPTAVLVLTGPPSCGKSGVRAPWFVTFARVVLTLRAMQRCSSNWWPAACNPRVRPSSTAAPAVRAAPVGECAATSTQVIAHQRLTLRWPVVFFCTDYMSPAAFSANLVKCIKNDWQLDDKGFSRLIPSLAKISSSAFGAEFQVEYLKAELLKDPRSSFQTITDAYLTLVKDAKQKRKAGDPWPVIIIDEANSLTKWKDTESLEQLLAFFVYLTKQEQLAHVILATSDTFLTQWLDSGASRLSASAFVLLCVH